MLNQGDLDALKSPSIDMISKLDSQKDTWRRDNKYVGINSIHYTICMNFFLRNMIVMSKRDGRELVFQNSAHIQDTITKYAICVLFGYFPANNSSHL